MKNNLAYTLALASVVSALLVGCQGADEDVYVPPAGFVLKGQPDPQLVGKWEATQGNSKYALRADGTYDFEGAAKTPSGEMKNQYTAKWAVDGNKIYFEDQLKNASCYIFKFEDEKLELKGTSATSKVASTLVRKSK